MEKYETKDFYLGCLLISNDIKLSGSHKGTDGVYFEFNIQNETLLGKLIIDFSNSKAMVNLKKMQKAMSTLRHELDKYRN